MYSISSLRRQFIFNYNLIFAIFISFTTNFHVRANFAGVLSGNLNMYPILYFSCGWFLMQSPIYVLIPYYVYHCDWFIWKGLTLANRCDWLIWKGLTLANHCDWLIWKGSFLGRQYSVGRQFHEYWRGW